VDSDETPLDRCEYLLPAGCKDLIDKIHLARARSLRKPRPRPKPTVYLPSRITVRDLAVALNAKLPAVIKVLKGMKIFTGLGRKIPFYTAARVAATRGYEAKKEVFKGVV
jgi:hypothetical protein